MTPPDPAAQERGRIVAWLRAQAEQMDSESAYLVHGIANDIERGDHHADR